MGSVELLASVISIDSVVFVCKGVTFTLGTVEFIASIISIVSIELWLLDDLAY